MPNVGALLQDIIDAAERVGHQIDGKMPHGITYAISDELGIAFAKQSLLDHFLKSFGTMIGAQRLAAVTVRNLAPDIDINSLDSGPHRATRWA